MSAGISSDQVRAIIWHKNKFSLFAFINISHMEMTQSVSREQINKIMRKFLLLDVA